MIQEATFWGFGSLVLICSFLVIHTRNIFRAALMLVASFLGVAALFVMLRAEFLGVIQVLVYVGAIAILILFGIMMTRDSEQGNLPSGNKFVGAFVGTLTRAGNLEYLWVWDDDTHGVGLAVSIFAWIPYLATKLFSRRVKGFVEKDE